MFSSHKGPSLVAQSEALFRSSLISIRYWTPVVWSTTTLAPSVSGPQHQIFLAAFSSHSNFSRMNLARSFASAFGPHLPSSMAAQSSSDIGSAVKYKRLCLFGDLAKQVWFDNSATVSL